MSGHLERSQQRRSSGSQSLPQSANSLRSSRNAQRPSASTAHNSSDEPQSPRNENALDHLPVDKETPKRRASRASKSIQRAHDIERDVNDGDDKGVVVDEQMIEQMEKEIEKSTQEIDRLLSKTESRLSRQRSKIQERRQRKSSNNNSASSPGLEMEQDQDQEQQQEDGRPLLHKNHDHDVPLLPRPTDPSPRIPPRRASHSMSSQEGQLVGGHASQKDAVNTKEKRRSSGLLASSPRNSVSLSPSASRRSSVSQSQDNGSSNSPTSHDAISTEQHGTKRLSHKRTSNEAMVSHEDGGKRKVSLSEIPIRDKGDVDAEMAVKSVFSAYANIANDTQVHSGRRGSKRRSSKGMESGNKSHGNRKSSTNSIHIDVAASMDEDHHPQSYLSEEDFVTLVRDSGLIPSSPSSSSSPSGLTRVDNAIGRTARQVFSLALNQSPSSMSASPYLSFDAFYHEALPRLAKVLDKPIKDVCLSISHGGDVADGLLSTTSSSSPVSSSTSRSKAMPIDSPRNETTLSQSPASQGSSVTTSSARRASEGGDVIKNGSSQLDAKRQEEPTDNDEEEDETSEEDENEEEDNEDEEEEEEATSVSDGEEDDEDEDDDDEDEDEDEDENEVDAKDGRTHEPLTSLTSSEETDAGELTNFNFSAPTDALTSSSPITVSPDILVAVTDPSSSSSPTSFTSSIDNVNDSSSNNNTTKDETLAVNPNRRSNVPSSPPSSSPTSISTSPTPSSPSTKSPRSRSSISSLSSQSPRVSASKRLSTSMDKQDTPLSATPSLPDPTPSTSSSSSTQPPSQPVSSSPSSSPSSSSRSLHQSTSSSPISPRPDPSASSTTVAQSMIPVPSIAVKRASLSGDKGRRLSNAAQLPMAENKDGDEEARMKKADQPLPGPSKTRRRSSTGTTNPVSLKNDNSDNKNNINSNSIDSANGMSPVSATTQVKPNEQETATPQPRNVDVVGSGEAAAEQKEKSTKATTRSHLQEYARKEKAKEQQEKAEQMAEDQAKQIRKEKELMEREKMRGKLEQKAQAAKANKRRQSQILAVYPCFPSSDLGPMEIIQQYRQPLHRLFVEYSVPAPAPPPTLNPAQSTSVTSGLTISASASSFPPPPSGSAFQLVTPSTPSSQTRSPPRILSLPSLLYLCSQFRLYRPQPQDPVLPSPAPPPLPPSPPSSLPPTPLTFDIICDTALAVSSVSLPVASFLPSQRRSTQSSAHNDSQSSVSVVGAALSRRRRSITSSMENDSTSTSHHQPSAVTAPTTTTPSPHSTSTMTDDIPHLDPYLTFADFTSFCTRIAASSARTCSLSKHSQLLLSPHTASTSQTTPNTGQRSNRGRMGSVSKPGQANKIDESAALSATSSNQPLPPTMLAASNIASTQGFAKGTPEEQLVFLLTGWFALSPPPPTTSPAPSSHLVAPSRGTIPTPVLDSSTSLATTLSSEEHHIHPVTPRSVSPNPSPLPTHRPRLLLGPGAPSSTTPTPTPPTHERAITPLEPAFPIQPNALAMMPLPSAPTLPLIFPRGFIPNDGLKPSSVIGNHASNGFTHRQDPHANNKIPTPNHPIMNDKSSHRRGSSTPSDPLRLPPISHSHQDSINSTSSLPPPPPLIAAPAPRRTSIVKSKPMASKPSGSAININPSQGGMAQVAAQLKRVKGVKSNTGPRASSPVAIISTTVSTSSRTKKVELTEEELLERQLSDLNERLGKSPVLPHPPGPVRQGQARPQPLNPSTPDIQERKAKTPKPVPPPVLPELLGPPSSKQGRKGSVTNLSTPPKRGKFPAVPSSSVSMGHLLEADVNRSLKAELEALDMELRRAEQEAGLNEQRVRSPRSNKHQQQQQRRYPEPEVQLGVGLGEALGLIPEKGRLKR